MNLTFQQKLEAIFKFGVTEVVPVVVTDPNLQNKVLPYVGLAYAGISLIEALFAHTPTPTSAVVPTQEVAK